MTHRGNQSLLKPVNLIVCMENPHFELAPTRFGQAEVVDMLGPFFVSPSLAHYGVSNDKKTFLIDMHGEAIHNLHSIAKL